MVTFLSTKLATLGLLRIKVFWNKGYDIIIFAHGVTNKILSRDSNYIVDMVMLPKFGNSRSNSLSFKHKRYCFLWVFRNYTDKKFSDFYCVCHYFGTIWGGFHFFWLQRNRSLHQFGPSEMVRYLMLDLLKIFSLWTIQKKATVNESLNV